jgi:hypothetical protein
MVVFRIDGLGFLTVDRVLSVEKRHGLTYSTVRTVSGGIVKISSRHYLITH